MSDCETVLRKAAGLHIDECEAVRIRKKITTVRITDSEIAEVKQNVEAGFAVRLVHEKKILSASSTEEGEDLIEKALQAKNLLQPKNFWKALPHPHKLGSVEKTRDAKLEAITGKEAIEVARIIIDSSSDEKITRVSGSLNIVSEEFEVANSSGLDLSDRATYIAGTINTESEFGGTPVSGIGAMSARTMDSFFPERIGAEAKEMCLGSVNPQGCEPGPYSIIFEPYAIGEMLAFVFSSNFSLKAYSEKRSCFSERLGKKIAADDFDLLDDPHHPGGVGSKPFDDEGVPTRTRSLVESGIFSGTFSDSFHAFKEGMESTGNACRMGSPMGRSYSPIPVPMPHNLMIKAGNASKDELIRETGKGLLIGRLWYTYSVNPERGDFSCTARSGIRMIERGKISGSAKPVRIIHNLPLLLMNISGIGKDLRNVLQWSALPCITPSIKADGIRAVPL